MSPTSSAQTRLAIGSILAALVLVILDSAIANIALPTIAQSLHTTAAHSVWVITSYQVALVLALLPCAALGESLGLRRVYVSGVAVFTLASLGCALSPTLPLLAAARFVQGLGGAAIMALGLAQMRLVVPPDRVGSAIGWNALVAGLSSAFGPTVGAVLLSRLSWPWLFAINIPLGVVVLIATRALPRALGTGRALDGLSVLLNALSFALLVLGAELLPSQPLWGALMLGVAAVTMAALIRRELPKAAPLIPLDLLRTGSIRLSVIASVCCFAGMATGMIALPFYLQHGLGLTPLKTGLYMTPWPLTVALAAPIAGRLADRLSTGWMCATGGAVMTLGLVTAALWPLKGNPAPLLAINTVCGLGFGMFQVPNNRNMLLAAPRERAGAAGGMQGTARQTGLTLGSVSMTLLFTVVSLALAPRIGLGLAALLTLTAGLVSVLRTRAPTAAPTPPG